MYGRFVKSTAVLLLFLMVFSLFNCSVILAETGTTNYDQSSFRAAFEDFEFGNVVLIALGQNPNNVDWTKVSDESLSKITYLNLNSSIQSLKGLEKLTGLQSMNILNTRIQGFPSGIENNLKNLKYLNLFNNQNALYIPKFAAMTYLVCGASAQAMSGSGQAMMISGQALDIRSKDSIQAMENLQYLDFSTQNQMAGILDYSGLKSLQTLNISSCDLYNVPESISSLSNLHYLNMEGNNISYIPDKLIEYAKSHDVKIYLSNNFISSVDSSLSGKVVISYSKSLNFNYLPGAISKDTKINILNFLNYRFSYDKYEVSVNSSNQPGSNNASISSDGILSFNAPGTYNITVKLKGASLDNKNAVATATIVAYDSYDPYYYNQEKMEREFPDQVFRNTVLSSLGQLPYNVDWDKVNKDTIENISYLHLYGDIQKLDGLEKLTGLQSLTVTGTSIQGFPSGVENNLKNLEYLSLRNNQNTLHIPKFVTLTGLSCGASTQAVGYPGQTVGYSGQALGYSGQTIRISGQSIDLDSKDSIQAMVNLQFLDLSTQNKMSGILDYSGLKALQTLDISYCDLDSVPESILSLPNLSNLNMEGNNLSFVPDKLVAYAKSHNILISLTNNFLNSVDQSVSNKIIISNPKRLAFQNLPSKVSVTDKINLINYLNYKFSPDKYVFSVNSSSQSGSNNASISSDGILSVNTPGTYNITVRLKGADVSNTNASATASITFNESFRPKIYDLDSDGYINMSDIMMIAPAFNSVKTSTRYNEKYDFNLDGAINMADIMMIASCFNMKAN